MISPLLKGHIGLEIFINEDLKLWTDYCRTFVVAIARPVPVDGKKLRVATTTTTTKLYQAWKAN